MSKIIIVTGASRGLGRAIALQFAKQGFSLILVARSAGDLKRVRSEALESSSPSVEVISCDLSLAPSADLVASAAAKYVDGVHGLVNCAGATKRGDFLELTDADWTEGFALKCFAAVRLSKVLWPMLKLSHGSVVNIIGAGGNTPTADFTIGGAVNSAMMNFTKALADRGVRDGVRVNAVNPGLILTDRLEHRISQYQKRFEVNRIEAMTMIIEDGQLIGIGEPDDIASAVSFLMSEGARYIHGAILDVDGGMTKGL